MDILKRAMIVAFVIASFILVTLGSRNGDADVAGKTAEDNGATIALSSAEVENLFFGQDSDRISMYGDPRYWDDEKNMSIDTNGDGQNEINFAISAGKNEGINLTGSVKQRDGSWKSMNFWSSDLYRLFRNSMMDIAQVRTVKAKDFLSMDITGLISLLREGKYIVRGSCITDDDYVQISVRDIDQDGSAEVLASVGNRLDGYVAAVYKVSFNKEKPFLYCGRIISE